LRELLRASLFEIEEEHILTFGQDDDPIHRTALHAKAVPPRAKDGSAAID
jgi:hypothetical protein